MVATKYTQSVGVKISTGGKIMLYAGIALQIASLALLIVGVFVNQFVLFAFIAVLGIGILLGQLYYAQNIEYNYHYAEDRLIFTKKDVRLRVKTLMTVKFDRIISYENFVDFVKNTDKVYLSDVASPENKVLRFTLPDGSEHRIIFTPDEYLNALINEFVKVEK